MSTDSPAPAPRRRAAFHELTVAATRRLTDDALEVTFTVPESLADAYAYAPGQYVALHAQIAGEELRRSYSICTAPAPGRLAVAIKRELGGRFSGWALDTLEPGMTLAVMSPEGRFTPRAGLTGPARYGAVAAGSGITPMMALIAHTLAAHPEHRFDLLYSNRTVQEAMFVDELAELKDRYPTRLALHHVLTRERRGSELLSGRLDADRLDRILGPLLNGAGIDEWFLCGPFELVQLCRDALTGFDVPAEAVHYELFSSGTPTHPAGAHGAPVREADTGEVHEVSFRLDGRTSTVTTPVHAGESILNAALRVRPDVPFACAGGVCGTCRARVLAGEVTMAENYALEPDELARGYVLTCQAVPATPAVSVDYDG